MFNVYSSLNLSVFASFIFILFSFALCPFSFELSRVIGQESAHPTPPFHPQSQQYIFLLPMKCTPATVFFLEKNSFKYCKLASKGAFTTPRRLKTQLPTMPSCLWEMGGVLSFPSLKGLSQECWLLHPVCGTADSLRLRGGRCRPWSVLESQEWGCLRKIFFETLQKTKIWSFAF